MSRLIDADALLREHCGALFYGEYASCEECQADGHICGLEIDAEDIKNAPTVDAFSTPQECIDAWNNSEVTK